MPIRGTHIASIFSYPMRAAENIYGDVELNIHYTQAKAVTQTFDSQLKYK